MPNFILGGTHRLSQCILSTDSGLTRQDLEFDLAQFRPHDRSRIIAIPWYANAFDGTVTATVSFTSPSPQLLMVWLLGTSSQDDFGRSRNPGGGASIVTHDTKVFAATNYYPSFTTANLALANAKFTDGGVVVTVTSYNAGVPLSHVSYFAVGYYYDEISNWNTNTGAALG